jgi:hypothetical protein
VFGLKSCKSATLNIPIVFRTCLKFQVEFYHDFNWARNYTSVDFSSYIVVGPINHLDERKRRVWN